MPSSKKKVVIIGGGAAGVFTAYLLQKQAKDLFDIAILEKRSAIGGHAHSVEEGTGSDAVHIDYGAQFFSETAQPEYCDMLRAENLDQHMIDIDMAVTLWDASGDGLLFQMPNSMTEIIKAAGNTPSTWFYFALMTIQANAFFQTGNWNTTFGEWIASLGLPIDPGMNEFKANVARPLMYQFGLVPPDQMDNLSARFVLYYFLGSLPKDPVGDALKGEKLRPFAVYNSDIGLDGILKALIQKYGLAAAVKPQTSVASITRQGSAYVVTDTAGTTCEADELVFATNPQQARDILPNQPGYQGLRGVLANMVFLDVLVRIQKNATPSGPLYMPTDKKQWSGSNVLVTDNTPATKAPTDYGLTIWFGALQKGKSLAAEFFKSWGSPNLSAADGPSHHDHHHWLMEGTPQFLAARTQLVDQHQGVDSRWFVGGYLVDYASQNAALRSANIVVRRILAKHGVAPAQPEFLMRRKGDVFTAGQEIFAALDLPEPLHFIAKIKDAVLKSAPQYLLQQWSDSLSPPTK